MATLLRSESRQMYSWWWDSHISPKNSKWLQENLTDMDVKIKSMIKLIEEDADSFARKAEMYYKKRPELMNLVEEFYRAYRALAERYDHATKVIRDAHSTSLEALPDQVPFSDDCSSPSAQADPRPPKLLNLNGDFTNELDSVTRRKTVKLSDDPLGPVECVRRGLNFDECEDKLQGELSNCNTNAEHRKISTSNKEVKEIVVLKEALATLEAEKEAGIVQYQHCLDKLSNLQSEMSKTREDFREQKDYGSKTEDNFVVPEEEMTGLYQENESKIQDYKQGVDGSWNLQTLLPTGQQAQKHVEGVYAEEIEAHQEVNKSAVERKDCLSNPVQLQETISNLENKLQLIEDDASRLKERAETAESEVEILKQLILKLTEEKETAATQHQKSLMTLSSLENKFTCALNKVKGLNVEISKGVSQMKSAEEKCLLLESMNRSLSSEMESLMLKMRNQTKELTEKQKKHEGRCISMEEEKESTRHEVKELQALLELEKQEHASYVQNSEIRFSGIDTEMKLLQEQYEWRMRELEQVLDNAIGSEIQLSVLRITAHQMKESNCSLSVENQRLKDESMLSTNKILKLERKILEQQVEIESLLNQNTSLKAGTCQLMKVLNIEDSVHEVEADEPYQEYANRLLSEILNMKKSLVEGVEENIENTVELPVHSMRIQQLGMDLQNLDLEKTNIGQELKVKTEQDLALQNEAFTLTHVHEEIRSKSMAGDGKNEAVETLNEKLSLKARLHELHDKRNKQNIQEEILQFELQKNQKEIDVMGTASASISSRLHSSVVNQLLYKQKALELHALSIYRMDQTKHLKTQLAAFGPELLSLKECISSLENHMDVHIKFQDPENDKSQDAQPENSSLEDIVINDKKAFMPNTFSDLRNLRVRLQAIIKTAVEMKEQQVQENANIRSKLDASTRQLELLQSQSQWHWRSIRSIPEITEADDVLSMKDIVLDQISDSSSHCFSNGEPVGMDSQTIELWETGSTDGNIGLTFHKPKRIVSPSSPDNTVLRHNKLMKKQNSNIQNSDSMVQQEPKVDKLGISKRSYDSVQEENNRKFLQRLKSDVQTLASLQNTVQDLKRKLEVTSKNRRGKEVIQCGSLKEQLEEADVTVAKLFGLHDSLMKSIGDCSSSSDTNSSFNLEEEDGNGKRFKMAQQAQKMAESIARLEVEVQKLQYSLQKLNNNEKGRITKILKTRQRTLLKDYLYGSHRHKKSPFCACMQPSTDEL